MLAALLNGSPVPASLNAVSVEERGLSYGDGVFETMRLRNGAVRFFEHHLARLRLGCERLGFAQPADELVVDDISRLARQSHEGVIKLIVTRGAGGRGYRAGDALTVTRIALLYPAVPSEALGIAARWCSTRLARNAQLAGIKHLNRLEQVLAQNEWHEPSIAEGIMLDTEGEVVCGTLSNLFVVNDGVLSTPDLRFSGVRGVMRQQVLASAKRLGLEVQESSLWPDDIEAASEVFMTNAVRGIRPVIALDERRWKVGAITQRLIRDLELVE